MGSGGVNGVSRVSQRVQNPHKKLVEIEKRKKLFQNTCAGLIIGS